jgi:ParB-like chromosome segregation protein Spo0J
VSASSESVRKILIMDTTASGISLDTIQLLPDKIKILPECNVRPFSTTDSNAAEERRIEALAVSIELCGQMDSLLITPRHELIAGHRRRRAVILINEKRTAKGQSLLRLRCSIDHRAGTCAARASPAISSATRRAPWTLPYLILYLRKDHGWEGPQGTRKVAEYLGVSEATVYQHERFLGVEREMQNLIHSGAISAKSALDLLKLDTPQERAKVLARASAIQSEERVEKAMTQFEQGKKGMTETTRVLQASTTRIENPAIVKAIRERHKVTPSTPHRKGISLSRAELISSIADLDSLQCCPACHEFVRYLVDVYAT